MTDPILTVLLAGSQQGRAVEVLAQAFQDDPAYAVLFPDARLRREALRWLWEGVVKYCLVYGRVYTTPEVQGAACWLCPRSTETTLWRTIRTGFVLPRAVMHFKLEERRRLLAALGYMDTIQKQVLPGQHWYLWVLGVDPAWQGQGIGGALIEPVLERSDDEGIPCYLEVMIESNAAFYAKYGFEVVHRGQVPDLDLTAWMMIRRPR